MCGIFCSLSRRKQLLPTHVISERLHARGPDSSGTKCIKDSPNLSQQQNFRDEIFLTFHSTVLSLRGPQTVVQPYQGQDNEFTLCWNGEAWNFDGRCSFNNDTEAVHQLLADASAAHFDFNVSKTDVGCGHVIAKTLSRINGPYSFVFFDASRGKLFLGRDFLGRRSLMRRTTNEGDLIISSISDGNIADGWAEIEADGVYCVDLRLVNDLVPFQAPHLRRWGSFSVEVFDYNFSHIPGTGAADVASMIPRLSLNKYVPAVHELLSSQSNAVTKLEGLLRDSLSLRLFNIPNPPSTLNNGTQCLGPAKVAILFSGGLDCTVLAQLSHTLLPQSESIDLLNVAFENPRIHNAVNTESNAADVAYELCPDRITGRASYVELQRVCPNRKWRFVAVDVPYIETQQNREIIISLMHPHNTEMDLSISTALFFAARGKGWISGHSSSNKATYTTTARVLLSGLGADELFAGYTRHATAFKRGGYDGLLDELELDVARLGQRNLGRDDRVMSHWGKEVRYPYLDEALVGWALDATVAEKCGFGEPSRGELSTNTDGSDVLEPGKKVLRCLAWRLGINEAAKVKKRAIQFGARTAKMESGRTKGNYLVT